MQEPVNKTEELAEQAQRSQEQSAEEPAAAVQEAVETASDNLQESVEKEAGAPQESAEEPKKKGWISKRTVASLVVSAVLSVAVIAATAIFGDENYYLSSILIIILTILPFFASFEGRRPQARELVVLAVLIAIAVAARAAFFWLPAFKPMTAVIIVSGIALGAGAGFMCGSLAAFVSNFMFGQGPWTPWQMLAYGLAGMVAGLLAQKGIIPRHDLSNKAKFALSLGSAIFVMFVVGPILDTCAVFTMPANEMIHYSAGAIYLSGIPINFVHALATFITLFVITNPMLDKLERIRVKYGMLS